MYSVRQCAEIFDVAENTIKLWLKHGKLNGTKQGKSWQISEDELRRLIPEAHAIMSGFFPDVPKSAVEFARKNLYAKEWEVELERQRHTDRQHEEDGWQSHFAAPYREEVEVRFPYPYNANEIVATNPDGSPSWIGGDELVYESYYMGVYKEEAAKFDRLLKLLQQRYGMKDSEVDEIRRTAENLRLLELAGYRSK